MSKKKLPVQGDEDSTGRPVALTPELIETAARHVKVGAPWRVAAGAFGIGKVTWFRWIKAGRAATSLTLERQFYLAVEKATCEALLREHVLVGKGGSGWQAAAWLLENVDPRAWP